MCCNEVFKISYVAKNSLSPTLHYEVPRGVKHYEVKYLQQRQGRCVTLPLFSFPHTNSESGHDRIKGTTLKQGGDLAFSLPEFLVCHNLLHPFFHGCQILEILKPAYSSYFAETVHVSTQLTTVFLSHPIGDLLCPLYRLWLFAWSNPCTSCPSNHVRTPFS